MPAIRFLDASPIDGEMREWPDPLPDQIKLPSFSTTFAVRLGEGGVPDTETVHTEERTYLRFGQVAARKDAGGKVFWPAATVYVWDRLWEGMRR